MPNIPGEQVVDQEMLHGLQSLDAEQASRIMWQRFVGKGAAHSNNDQTGQPKIDFTRSPCLQSMFPGTTATDPWKVAL